MAVIEEELHPMLLGLDGVLLAPTEERQLRDRDLVTSRCAFVRPHDPRQLDAALLRERPGQRPELVPDLRPDDHPLHQPRPVAESQEGDPSVHPERIDPAGDGDGFAGVAGKIADFGHGGEVRASRCG